jgi:hypothetical protein
VHRGGISALQTLGSKQNQRMSDYCKNNSLIINEKKCHFVLFGKTTWDYIDNFNLSLNNVPLQRCETTRQLGLSLHANGSWLSQINDVTKKLSSCCYLIKTLSKSVYCETLKTLYYANFQSIMSYGIIFWGFDPAADKVFKVQKRAVRMICTAQPGSHCKPFFIKTGILTFYCLLVIEAVCFTVRNIDLFAFLHDRHNYNTRKKDQLIVKRPNFVFDQKRNPSNFCIKCYNWAHPVIKKYKHVRIIRKKLQLNLANNPCYNIDEVFQLNISVW